MERSKLQLCKYCDSGRLRKDGFRKNKNNKIQKFYCLDCKKGFTANFGFEKMRYDDVIITRALQMYYSKMSVRRIADFFTGHNNYHSLFVGFSLFQFFCF